MFAVIGEALIDMMQPEPGLTFLAKPGGGPTNIAVGLKRLGHPTVLMARLSDGPLGELVKQHIVDNDLTLDACVSTSDQTTLAFASLDAERRASYEFYVRGTADWGWTEDELAVLPPDATAIHTGSVAAFISPGSDALLALWRRVWAAGEVLLSFDPNVRPALVGTRERAVSVAEGFVSTSHVVKASDEDLGWLYPDDDLVSIVRRWASMGPELVVMTRGPEGCFAVRSNGQSLERPGAKVDVVDTIGAGDAFESGLLSGLADAGAIGPGGVAGMSDADLDAVLARAIVVSAMTCQREGADPPTREAYEGGL